MQHKGVAADKSRVSGVSGGFAYRMAGPAVPMGGGHDDWDWTEARVFADLEDGALG